ncbi:transcription antitermination factor NusB [Coxiella endosymbiont of Rhipicephalus microplus]|uniref:transcription antitermination factor NusB n=1 Tax=Coxiella endosymbiont of Rhipicephalus microplus TaxID=1656186 RepID=UPI000C7FBCC6|nr:transcription antitermination factor NusB [Coxiella endosymbiont of Rhipicephalus microplus]PMB54481.1 Transcription termination protein NusB [Coxiella-like endosymbiont]
MKNNKRHNARRYSLQALYQWAFGETPSDVLINKFSEEHDISDADFLYFKDLIMGTIQDIAFIEKLIVKHLDRDINALNPVELAVLRLATYELLYRKDVPYKVIIDEAVELVKEFGAQEGYKYVNAVLDVLSNQIRKRV